MPERDKEIKPSKPKCIAELPCPYAGIKCPCGCGQTYSGMCLRPHPCPLCQKNKNIVY